jgi:protein-S-isoprenylcysteine O-methyltransferase Ste14
MLPGLIRSIILLPGTVLVFIPSLLLWISWKLPRYAGPVHFSDARFWVGAMFLVTGLILAIWTVRLQLSLGKGTPAPWDPAVELVIQGPYRHSRNPMITGAFFVLIGEALLFQSWLIAGWFIMFWLANLIYIPFIEEVQLEKRFGDTYLDYVSQVPRWIPRLRPHKNA